MKFYLLFIDDICNLEQLTHANIKGHKLTVDRIKKNKKYDKLSIIQDRNIKKIVNTSIFIFINYEPES